MIDDERFVVGLVAGLVVYLLVRAIDRWYFGEYK